MITELTALQVSVLRDQIVAVYEAAFSGPPYFKARREADDFAAWLPQHVLRPHFRFIAALDEASGALAGFAYGYGSIPGQWWHDQVSRSLVIPAAREWLADAFQLSEVAVAPPFQGRGLGRELHDAVLGLAPGSRALPYPRAVLSTLSAETTALGMYRRRGWETLLDPFSFPGVARAYRIMGLRLR